VIGLLTNNFSGVVNSSVGNIFTSSPVVGSTTLDYQSKIDWFYTIRGRIGYVWGNGDLLTYVTGGVAIGEVHSEVTHAFSGTLTGGGLSLPFSIPATSAISDHDVNVGWVVGFGTEGRWAWTNWTWKIEGLYVDLGTLDTTVPAGRSLNSAFISGFGNPFADIVATAGPVTTHTHFTDGIVRVGLNYQFH
jgi:outer membrane immunogenic protein